MKKILRWYDYISINLFWMGLNIRNNAVNSIFLPYLVALFVSPEIKNTALGEMRTAGLIIAMLVQPAMGLLSDRSTSKFGRRRPFIFVGVLLDLVFLTLIAMSGNYWFLLVASLLTQFSANISHGALQGLIPDLVPENKRGVASGVKSIMELIPLVILAMTIAKLVGNGMFGWAVVATGASLLVIMLLTMVLVKEEPLTEKPTEPIGPTMVRVLGMLVGILAGAVAGLAAGGLIGGAAGLITSLFAADNVAWCVGIGLGGLVAMTVAIVAGVYGGTRTTLGKVQSDNRSFYWWVVNRLMFFTSINSIQAFAVYFIMHSFQITVEESTMLTSNLIMVVGLCTILTAVPAGWLADKFGQRLIVTISGWGAALGTVVLICTVFAPGNMVVLFVAGGILGLSTGLFVTTNWAMGTRLVPHEKAGLYLGVSNLAGAGAGMIGAGMGGPIADYLNRYIPGIGYLVIFGIYAVIFVLSTFVLKGIPNQIKKAVQTDTPTA